MPNGDCLNGSEAGDAGRQCADSGPTLRSRRDVVSNGVKLAFVTPVVSTFIASRAYAANYSCYPLDHGCDFDSESKRQACCDALVCKTAGGFPVGPATTGTCKP